MVRFGDIGSTMVSCISTSCDGCSCDCEWVECGVGEGETNGSNLSGCDCGAGCGEACDKPACEDECTALLPGDGCNDVAGNASCDVIAWGEKRLPCDDKDPTCGSEGDSDVGPRVACGVVNTSGLRLEDVGAGLCGATEEMSNSALRMTASSPETLMPTVDSRSELCRKPGRLNGSNTRVTRTIVMCAPFPTPDASRRISGSERTLKTGKNDRINTYITQRVVCMTPAHKRRHAIKEQAAVKRTQCAENTDLRAVGTQKESGAAAKAKVSVVAQTTSATRKIVQRHGTGCAPCSPHRRQVNAVWVPCAMCGAA